MFRKIIPVVAAVLIGLLFLLGCKAGQKYELILPRGFTSKKSSYAAGESVTVRYGFVPTDTLTLFFCDADDFKEFYSEEEGYYFTFTMPARDVRMWRESRNDSVYRPEYDYSEDELKAAIREERMVFDYYEATVATVGGDGYTEYVLYRWDETDLLLARYSRQGTGTEHIRVCRVPLSYLYDCLIAVGRTGMRSWKDGVPMTGMVYVVKFTDGDQVVRISSDNMPEDGKAAFHTVGSVLENAWSYYGPKQ